MTFQCDSCSQPALETDTICWHCGKPLTHQHHELVGERIDTTSESQGEEAINSFSFSRLIVYSCLLLSTIVALLIVTAALERQPQVVQSLGRSRLPGWTAVTDQNKVFTLDLPVEWQWLDRHDNQQEDTFVEMVRQNSQYQASFIPYDDLANDWQLLFLAVGNQSGRASAMSPFLLIAQSQQLSQYTPEQITALLREGPSGTKLLRSNLMEGVNGRQQVINILSIPYSDQTMRCQHLFLPEPGTSYLVIGCAGDRDYQANTNVLHDILVSFQLLIQ